MAAVKAVTAFTWASGSSTTTGVTNPISTASHYEDDVWGNIVVVGTPSAPASIQVEESPDGGTTWYALPEKVFTTNIVAGSYPFSCPIELSTTDVQISYVAQTGGTSSTFTAQLSSITGI